jgi:hypothetical protein
LSCPTISLKRGEQKTLTFTVRDSSRTLIDMTGATFDFEIESSPGTPLVTKSDVDFDKTDVATGIVKVTLSSTDTDQSERTYDAELKITFAGGDIDKSETIAVTIERAIT